jgi:hypothetical protein
MYSVYELVPISIQKLMGKSEKDEWTIEDINRCGVMKPGIQQEKDGVYLGNFENGKMESLGVYIDLQGKYKVIYS